MLMPTKHIKSENAIIGVGAEILGLLPYEKTVSRLFHDLQIQRRQSDLTTLHFDWFLLSLDFLFLMNAIRFENGVLKKLN